MPCNECSRLPIEQNTENMEGNMFQSRKESNKQDEAKREGAHNVKQTQKTIRQSQCTASSGILPLDTHKRKIMI